MFYQATIHVLLRGADSQDEACDGMSEMLSHIPDFVVDWAYARGDSGAVLLPIPRPDLRHMGYEEGEFLNTLNEPQHPCPYCSEPMQVIGPRYYYDQDGYSEMVLWCPNCEAQQMIKNIPGED